MAMIAGGGQLREHPCCLTVGEGKWVAAIGDSRGRNNQPLRGASKTGDGHRSVESWSPRQTGGNATTG